MTIIKIFGFKSGDINMRFKEPVMLCTKIDPSIQSASLLFVEHPDYHISVYGRSAYEVIENWVDAFQNLYEGFKKRDPAVTNEDIVFWTDEKRLLWNYYQDNTEPGNYPPAEFNDYPFNDYPMESKIPTSNAQFYQDSFTMGFNAGRDTTVETLKIVTGLVDALTTTIINAINNKK